MKARSHEGGLGLCSACACRDNCAVEVTLCSSGENCIDICFVASGQQVGHVSRGSDRNGDVSVYYSTFLRRVSVEAVNLWHESFDAGRVERWHRRRPVGGDDWRSRRCVWWSKALQRFVDDVDGVRSGVNSICITQSSLLPNDTDVFGTLSLDKATYSLPCTKKG